MKSRRNTQKTLAESHDLGITRSAGIDLTLEDIKAIAASVCVQSEMVEGSIHPKALLLFPIPLWVLVFAALTNW